MPFTNLNTCRSFVQPFTTTVAMVSTVQECSEVIVYNAGSDRALLFDNGYSSAANSFILSAGQTFTLRGITNLTGVSAAAGVGTTVLYFRTQSASLQFGRMVS